MIDRIILSDQERVTNGGVAYTIKSINARVAELIKANPAGYIAFQFEGIDPVAIPASELDKAQVWTFDLQAFPALLSYSVPSSFFNLQPIAAEHTTWLVSLKNCIINKSVITSSFLDESFNTVSGATLWWAYKQLWSGTIIRHRKWRDIVPESDCTDADQLRMVYLHQGLKWAGWTCLRVGLKNLFRGLRLLSSLQKFSGRYTTQYIDWSKWKESEYDRSARVTILIPTVDRYPYLNTLLTQLADQVVKPSEIIVVDQTAEPKRQPLVHPQLPLSVYYLDEAGQCRSRNHGLQNSSGDYILFLDDDDEVYPELIQDHLKTLSFFDADASCGVCQEPGQKETPELYRRIRASDLLSTNNGMVRRSALTKSGLFDMVYDRGQRADGDLGARLYLTGALIILNPSISVFHHRAPQGGLRKHNVRKVTYATSRSRITHRRLPHVTELYFNLKYFTKLQQSEYRLLSALGTLSIRGGVLKKLLKVGYGLVVMPNTLWLLFQRQKRAEKVLQGPSNIPYLEA
ncbi:MAG: glycosyltransferase family 2 protein [Cytophagales bacterium]|nr:glycosyltransferase family 2 protein [Cytophagales bacterium]